MLNLLKKIVDLLLYGNLWIALCALAMAAQSQLLLKGQFERDALLLFIFFATLFLYAIHRIIGISKLHKYFEADRYGIIVRFKSHIKLYAIIGGLGMLWYFGQLSGAVQLALVVPALLSLGYTLPFLKGKQLRLRDLDFIKIFLVAGVWAWVSVLLPALEYGCPKAMLALMLAERSCFVFAITLPFDIRDLKVDASSQLRTLPAAIGINRSKWLAISLLGAMSALAAANWWLGNYPAGALLGIALSAICTGGLVWWSEPWRHDYFYSGLMDGTMILQAVLVGYCLIA